LSLVRHLVAISDEELDRMLTALQLAEFIYEQPAPGGVEYIFKHALTQEVAYNSVLIERRRALHERTGAAIERLFADRLDDYVSDLAYHYDRSGNLRKAVEYLGRAARRAVEQVAHSEVVGHVTRALELIRRLPDGADRTSHELELQITLSESLLVAMGPGSPEREKALARALELCEKIGDNRIMEVTLSLASLRWSHSEPLLALQLCEKALALAEQAKDADVRAAAHAGIGLQLLMLGQFEKAREHLEGAIELSGGRPIRTFGQVSAMVQSAPFVLGLTLSVIGYPITALKRSKDALDTVSPGSERFTNTVARGMYVITHLIGLRDIRGVAEQVEQLAAITAERELPIGHLLSMFFRAWLNVDAGRVKEGLGEMERIITRFSGTVPPVDWLVGTTGSLKASTCPI
jgi:tetratricopeptide (TPR) repeat protein